MNTIRSRILALVVVAGALAAPAVHASIVIINDSFSRPATGTANLNGSTASPVDTTAGSHTWSVGPYGSITTDGSVAQLSGAGAGGLAAATLPFQLADAPAHYPISLSADVSVTDPDNNGYFVVLGFAPGPASNVDFSNAGPWIILTAGGQLNGFTGPGTSGTSSTFGTPSGPGHTASANLKISYNPDSQVASFYLNNSLEGSLTLASAPTINNVLIELYGSDNNATGTFDNLLVTSEIPEPSSVLLILAGGLLLWRRQRRSSGVME